MANISQVDQATFQKLLASDPDVQAVIRRVWGDTPLSARPSDTPKNLEQANKEASQQIGQILKAKGVQLPKHTFINPRSGSLESEHGWAGLPTGVKIAIIAGVAATGIGAAGAMGAFGGSAAAGAGSAGAGGASAAGAAGLGASGAGAAGLGGAGLAAGGAAAGGAGATTAGVSGALAGASTLSKIAKAASAASSAGKLAGTVGPMATGLAAGMQKGREAENAAAGGAAQFNLAERQGNEANLENRAGLDLRKQQFGIDSQNNAYRNALRSSLVKNMQDVKLNLPAGIPKFEFSGGMRPSALGPEGKAAADVMNQKAMASLMDGEKFDALPALERTAAPTYTKPGMAENLLGGIGMGANAISGANAAAEQSDYQKKIMAALAGLSAPKATTGNVIPDMEGLG